MEDLTTTPFVGFYSDPHFGHRNIIDFAGRPFNNLRVMNEELILRYNDLVYKDEWVCWVGDCFLMQTMEESRQILDKLNGHKILVKGNHDGSNSKMLKIGFAAVMQEMFVMVSGRLCRVNHFPYRLTPKQIAKLKKQGHHVDLRYPERRPERVKGEILIHGHTHSAEKYRDNMVHVGVDAWNWGPALIGDVAAIVEDL